MTKAINPMLERVARAIDPGVWNLLDLWRGDLKRLDDWNRAAHGRSITQARAAIQALLEPDEAMVEAGRWPAEDDGPFACWTAMLSTIMDEGEK
jgi:hypothetical protein